MKPEEKAHAEHGGAFFDAIGVGFDHLDRSGEIISADVLDAWYDPSPQVLKALRDHLPWLVKTSSPTHGEGLIDAIAAARSVPRDCILVGGGTSAIMYTAFPALVDSGKTVLLFDPMYGEYRHIFENVLKCNVLFHPLRLENGFAPDEPLLKEQAKRADMAVVVHPNSPTGALQDRAIEILLENLASTSKLWIDETYVDFAGPSYSYESRAVKDARIVVAKSMSKFYALSGLRVGYLVSARALVHSLAPAFPPWSVGLLAQVAAVEALRNSASHYTDMARQTALLREELGTELSELAVVGDVYASVANFLLVKLNGEFAARIVDLCQANGVFLRDCDSMSPRFEGRFVRIAVKDKESNKKIVSAISVASQGL